jgi:hypothetical protein
MIHESSQQREMFRSFFHSFTVNRSIELFSCSAIVHCKIYSARQEYAPSYFHPDKNWSSNNHRLTKRKARGIIGWIMKNAEVLIGINEDFSILCDTHYTTFRCLLIPIIKVYVINSLSTMRHCHLYSGHGPRVGVWEKEFPPDIVILSHSFVMVPIANILLLNWW